MNFRCSELQGAVYQPKKPLGIGDYWVLSARGIDGAIPVSYLKMIFISQECISKNNRDLAEHIFVYCYQFVFRHLSDVYRLYSLSRINRTDSFILSGADIAEIEKQIQEKFGIRDKELSLLIDFTEIDNQYTGLPRSLDFRDFYEKFFEIYKKDNKFREIIALFCETINGLRPLYNNVFQQIAQLQIIFEYLLGYPESKKCSSCKNSYYVEEWDAFLKRRLKDCGVSEPDEINNIIKIKKILNKSARIEYIHKSTYYNPHDPKNIVADFEGHENFVYQTDIKEVLNQKASSWKAIDWENIYIVYMSIVRNLIFSKYF